MLDPEVSEARPCEHAKQDKYHVRNWAEYNAALRRRGDLTIWFAEEAIAKWQAAKTGKPGGHKKYSDVAIETGLVVRLVYKLAYRHTQGFLNSIASLRVPDRMRDTQQDDRARDARYLLRRVTCDQRGGRSASRRVTQQRHATPLLNR